MKVLMVNGSPHQFGCTYTALYAVADVLKTENINAEISWIGDEALQDCTHCNACQKLGKCIFDEDIVNELIEKSRLADGLILGAPVMYANPGGRMISVLDRLFYAGGKYLNYKPAAALVSARRAGTTAALDVLNKYFTINKMPVVSSQYWNIVHGRTPEETRQDIEGVQTLKVLGQNMAWFLKSIEFAKKNGYQPPKTGARQQTNFIR